MNTTDNTKAHPVVRVKSWRKLLLWTQNPCGMGGGWKLTAKDVGIMIAHFAMMDMQHSKEKKNL